MVFMVSYTVLALPFLWVTNRFGLRGGILVGAMFTAMGAWIRAAATDYPLLLAGQTIISLGQLPLLGSPPRVSLTWFGHNEWSLATSVAVLANQAGGAVAYVLSPAAIPSPEGVGMQCYLTYQAAACTAACVFVAVFVPSKPARPASYASALAEAGSGDGSGGKLPWSQFASVSVRDAAGFFKGGGTWSGLLLTLSYGTTVGVSYAVSTLLAGLLSPLNPSTSEVGWVGFVITTVGLAGSVGAGILLDRYRQYHASLVMLIFLSAVSLAALASAVSARSLPGCFVAAASLGLSLTGVLPVGFEFAVELAFPASEDLVATLLNVSAQIFGVLLILGTSKIQYVQPAWALVAALSAAFVLAAVVRGESKRQAAQADAKPGLLVGGTPLPSSSSHGATLSESTKSPFHQVPDGDEEEEEEGGA